MNTPSQQRTINLEIVHHPLMQIWHQRHTPQLVTIRTRPITEYDRFGMPSEFDEYLDAQDELNQLWRDEDRWQVEDGSQAEREYYALRNLIAQADGYNRPTFDILRTRVLTDYGYPHTLVAALRVPPSPVPALHAPLWRADAAHRPDWYWTYDEHGQRITGDWQHTCGAPLSRVNVRSCNKDGSQSYGPERATEVCLACGWAKWDAAGARQITEILGPLMVLADPNDYDWESDADETGAYRRLCMKRAGALIPATQDTTPTWPDPEIAGKYLMWNPEWS